MSTNKKLKQHTRGNTKLTAAIWATEFYVQRGTSMYTDVEIPVKEKIDSKLGDYYSVLIVKTQDYERIYALVSTFKTGECQKCWKANAMTRD